ncbi:MAG: formylglycine-generating enzyme family protein [Desulfamplus sp.]|nr:formylglycine-generating enzyme family protein [Desulfamplus sp.]
MNNAISKIVITLIQQHGEELALDRVRFEGYLRDWAADRYPREINILLSVQKVGVPQELILARKSNAIEARIKILADNLFSQYGLDADAALWGVEAWALALGMIARPLSAFHAKQRGQASSSTPPPKQPPSPQNVSPQQKRVPPQPQRVAPQPQRMPPPKNRYKRFAVALLVIITTSGSGYFFFSKYFLPYAQIQTVVHIPQETSEAEALALAKEHLPEKHASPLKQIELSFDNHVKILFLYIASSQDDIKGFYLAETETTQAQWAAIMKYNPAFFNDDSQNPVEQVSWFDIQDFIKELNKRFPRYRFRLPYESEWGHAAAETRDLAIWDNCIDLQCQKCPLDQVAWWCGNSFLKTHRVKTKSPNHFGIYDLLGNVSEWCEENENANEHDNGSSPETKKLLCGGGWSSNSNQCRSLSKVRKPKHIRSNDIGFRLVLQTH